MPTPEGKVKDWVKQTIREYEHTHSTNIYTNWPVPGGYGESMLDLVGCAYGRMFMIETKAPGKTMTDRQKQCAARVVRAGGVVYEIDRVHDTRMVNFLMWLDRMRLLATNTDNEIDQDGRVMVRV